MPVTVLHRSRHDGWSSARLRADARTILAALEQKRGDLTVVLVDDASIRELNRRYRRENRATDVLAFAVREGPRTPGDERHLGDVVISLETAARQAKRRRRSLEDEVRTLLVHGTLHLLGYDHEGSAAEATRMRAKERELAHLLARE